RILQHVAEYLAIAPVAAMGVARRVGGQAEPDLEPERRAKLMAIVVDDVSRLNRLISDISDASRLDAELMRGEVKPVDLNALLSDMVRHYAVTAV
ncbi:MAG TPA: hypothetical protein VLL30_21185, partial [Reyranella sp.]|nr:hypothetical protein [Reyranella sp.]